jgi:predicted O-methyltransferase YrrM
MQKEFFRLLSSLGVDDGNLTNNDAAALISLAKKQAKEGCLFLEVGAWKGKSTICLASVAAKYKDGFVYTVDHFKGAGGTQEERIANATNILPCFIESLKQANAWQKSVFLLYMPFRDAARILHDYYWDLVFIDHDNRYVPMQEAIDYAISLARFGGIVCGRNLLKHYPDVKELVDEGIDQEYLPQTGLHPGVIKAVDDAFGKKYSIVEKSSVWYWVKK